MPYKNTLMKTSLTPRYQALNSPKGVPPRIEHITFRLPCLHISLHKQGNPFVHLTFDLPCASLSTYPGHKPVTLSHVPPTLTTLPASHYTYPVQQGNPFVRSQISRSPSHVPTTRAEIPAHKRPTLCRDLVIFPPFTVTFNLPCLGYIV